MNLFEVIFKYPTAWKFAGKAFRNHLLGKFEFEFGDSRVSVPVAEANWPNFKAVILKFHETMDPRGCLECDNVLELDECKKDFFP